MRPVYLITSAQVGLIAAAGAGAIGTGLGWLIARCSFPGRKLLSWVLVLPLAMPAYVAAYAWLDLSQAGGPLDVATAGLFPTIRGEFDTIANVTDFLIFMSRSKRGLE